jgi:hypothetical protein
MKAKHAVSHLVFGYCLDSIGGLFKILHRANADTLLIVAAVLKVSGALLFLLKLWKHPKVKAFLDL